MTGSDPKPDIDQNASDWVARQDRGLTETEAQELKTWRAADMRHEGAYMRAQAAWLMMDRARALPNEAVVAPNPSLTKMAKPVLNRRALMWGGGAVAASLAGAVFGLPYLDEKRFVSARGEIRRVPLADGSSVTLNTLSRIRVRMTPLERTVILEAGEALFEVAKDATRPFTVISGSVKVQAVGTAFNVAHVSQAVDVMVTEGTVEVSDEAFPALKRLRAVAGESLSLLSGQVERSRNLPEAQINRLAWRSGDIIMDGEALSEAAARFNRFNATTLRVDKRIAGLKVVGNFKAQDPEGFAQAISAAFDLTVEHRRSEIILKPS